METQPVLPPLMTELRERFRARSVEPRLVKTDGEVPGLAVPLDGGNLNFVTELPEYCFVFQDEHRLVGFVGEVDHLDDDQRSERARRWLLDWNYRRAAHGRAGVDERDGEVRFEFQFDLSATPEQILAAVDEVVDAMFSYWSETLGAQDGTATHFVH